jgi:urease accessory protein
MDACPAIRITATAMAEQRAGLLRLMTWLSPVFPVGGFSYSHGLERAVHDGRVADRDGLEAWLGALIEIGSGWNDAVLFAEAWRRADAGEEFGELAELAEALAGSLERHRETTLQGAAFLAAAAGWPHPVIGRLPETPAYCIAVGAVSGAHAVPLSDALAAYLQAFCANLAQAAIRLSVTGQSGAVATIAALEPRVLAVAARAAQSTLDGLGSASILSDIMAMNHETQYSRLFRT